MKKREPEEERFFKDIVLNHILEEIANENGRTLQRASAKPEKRIKKWIIWVPPAVMATLLSAFLLSNAKDKATASQKPAILPKQTAMQASKPEPEKTKTVQQQQQSPEPQIQIKKADRSLIITAQTPAENVSKPAQQTEREKAKAQLLQQMKN